MQRFYLRFLRKTKLFGPNGSEGNKILIFQNKNPKISLICPEYHFGDVREIF